MPVRRADRLEDADLLHTLSDDQSDREKDDRRARHQRSDHADLAAALRVGDRSRDGVEGRELCGYIDDVFAQQQADFVRDLLDVIYAVHYSDRLIDLASAIEESLRGLERKEERVAAELRSRGEDADDLDALSLDLERAADSQAVALSEIIAEHRDVGIGFVLVERPSSDEFRIGDTDCRERVGIVRARHEHREREVCVRELATLGLNSGLQTFSRVLLRQRS